MKKRRLLKRIKKELGEIKISLYTIREEDRMFESMIKDIDEVLEENHKNNTRINDVDYVWGDFHLGSKGLFNRIYSKTFDSIESYHNKIITEHNRVIRDDQVVLFLGDIGHLSHFDDVFPKLNGYKILILGNHDTYSINVYLKYFDEVFKNNSVFIAPRIVASHVPVPVEKGVINIHGHTHMIKLDSDNHINLCPEHTEYKPVKLDKIRRKLSKLGNKPSIRFLEEWYADIQLSPERDDLVIDEKGLIDVEESKKLLEENRKKRKESGSNE